MLNNSIYQRQMKEERKREQPNYLMHYGKQGMKWGFTDGIKNGLRTAAEFINGVGENVYKQATGQNTQPVEKPKAAIGAGQSGNGSSVTGNTTNVHTRPDGKVTASENKQNKQDYNNKKVQDAKYGKGVAENVNGNSNMSESRQAALVRERVNENKFYDRDDTGEKIFNAGKALGSAAKDIVDKVKKSDAFQNAKKWLLGSDGRFDTKTSELDKTNENTQGILEKAHTEAGKALNYLGKSVSKKANNLGKSVSKKANNLANSVVDKGIVGTTKSYGSNLKNKAKSYASNLKKEAKNFLKDGKTQIKRLLYGKNAK